MSRRLVLIVLAQFVVLVGFCRATTRCSDGAPRHDRDSCRISLNRQSAWRLVVPVLPATSSNQSLQLIVASSALDFDITWSNGVSSSADIFRSYGQGQGRAQPPSALLPTSDKNEHTLEVVTRAETSHGGNGSLYSVSVPRAVSTGVLTSSLYIVGQRPLTVSVVHIGSCASYNPLPQSLLGLVYEVITWSPVGQPRYPKTTASFSVVGQPQSSRTLVQIKLTPRPVPPLGRPCPAVWSSPLNNFHGFEGVPFNTTTVDACKAVCETDYSCLSIDWNPGNPTGSCWLIRNTIAPGYQPGITHYSIIARPTQCTGVQLPCSITFGGMVRLQCGDVIRLTLYPGDVATFSSFDVDLTGTIVEASAPIAVLTGDTDVSIPAASSTISDSTASQLFPVTSWGTQYAVAPIPRNSVSGYSVKITSGGAIGVVVSISASEVPLFPGVYVLQPFVALTLDFVDNSPIYISSTSPVQVVQFVRGATVASDTGAPASLALPPVSLFDSSYQFVDPSGGYVHYLMVVINRTSTSGLIVNGVAYDQLLPSGTSWIDVGVGSGLVTSSIQLPTAGEVTVQHTGASPFGAYRYSYIRGSCAFAYSAGAKVPVQNTTTSSVSATTTATIIVRPTQPIDVGCVNDNMGTDFVLAFIENMGESATDHLQIYPASFSRSSYVSVNITLSPQSTIGSWNQSFQMNIAPSRSVVVEVPSELELSGTGLWRKAVLVHAAEKIGLYSMSISDEGSCDGFVALPTESLGTEYFAMCYFPTAEQSEIGIVALYDDTTVTVTLLVDAYPEVYILWNNQNIFSSSSPNSFTIRLNNSYDTAQIMDYSDLTGTRLVSNRPIAVFSGNNYIVDFQRPLQNPVHLVEQMVPVADWGSKFYLMPLPEVAEGYTIRVITATSGNNVTVDTWNSSAGRSISSFILSKPGDYNTLIQPGGSYTILTSDRPILVAQFAGTAKKYELQETDTTHRAMQLIPPTELYRPWYTFSTQQGQRLSNFTHYLLIVVDRSAVDGLFLDDQPIGRAVNWTSFGSSTTVGGAISIRSGVHVVVQSTGIPFGAYVFGLSSTSKCIYAYSAGLCLGTPGNLTTFPPPPPTPTSNLSTVGLATDCSCLTLSSPLQPTYNGVYYVLTNVAAASFPGLPVYWKPAVSGTSAAGADCDLFIYSYSDQNVAYWVVGPVVGGRTGAIVGGPGLSVPYNIKQWSAYVNGSFLIDPNAVVSCLCPVVTACRSVEFIQTSTGSSPYDGVFFALNTTFNSRPVYRYEVAQPSLYLYYSLPGESTTVNSSATAGMCSTGSQNARLSAGWWSVAGSVGDSRPMLISTSETGLTTKSAADLINIAGLDVWSVFDPTSGTFRPKQDFTLICYK